MGRKKTSRRTVTRRSVTRSSSKLSDDNSDYDFNSSSRHKSPKINNFNEDFNISNRVLSPKADNFNKESDLNSISNSHNNNTNERYYLSIPKDIVNENESGMMMLNNLKLLYLNIN